MNAESITTLIGHSLNLAATLLGVIGDVVNAKKVREILRDGGYPSFPGRAADVGDEALAAFKPRPE